MKKLICLLALINFAYLFAQQSEAIKQLSSSSSTLIPPISVTIGGNFVITGSFSTANFQRVDNFITTYFNQAQVNALRGLTKIEDIQMVNKNLEKYALRDITLKRKNGDIIKIDLLKYRLTGDFKYNPYLVNDDVIIFPSYDSEKSFVDVVGAVNKPTKFQFVSGDKLSDAILLAGGLNSSYENVTKAEISRLDKTGNREELLTVNISDDISLKSGDRIRILADENQKKNYKVLVLGQVHKPGYIHVSKDGMPLSEIIKRAGGTSENADLRRAEVIRDYSSIEMLRKYSLVESELGNSDQIPLAEFKIKQKQLKEMLELARTTTFTEEDSVFFKIDTQLKSLGSSSLVDFTKIADSNSDESKFLVKDGDLVLIPDQFDYVYVFGQVAKVGYVKYKSGADYNYYISKAGGATETAKSLEKSIIIKGKDLNWVEENKSKVEIEPGDYVYLPKDPPRSFWYTMSKVVPVTSIIGTVATVILLFVQLGK